VPGRRIANQYLAADARRRQEELAASWSLATTGPSSGHEGTLDLTPASAALTLRRSGQWSAPNIQAKRSSQTFKGHLVNEDTVKTVLNDPLALQLLASSVPARPAYTALDGKPRVVPIGFLWDGARFVICTVPGSAKVRALEARPDVAMTIDTETWPPNALLVRGQATTDLVAGVPTEYLEACRKVVPAAEWGSRTGYGRFIRR
jgi:Pyridoxamine 5'-phosphate oxidase